MRPLRALATALIVALALPAVVIADAELVTAVPAADSTITDVPDEVVLTFDEPLSDRSSITVVTASGRTVATGALDPADPTILRGPLHDLAAGTYEVQWVADSADGHLARDTYTFTVAAPTPPATPSPRPSDAPSPSPTPVATVAPSPSPSGSDDGAGSDAADVAIPIVAGLAVLGLGLWWLLRRR